MNRIPPCHVALFLLASAIPAVAMAQAPLAPATAACAECGVVRSVKRVEAAPRPAAPDSKGTPGYVASIPLGGGKPSVGSSTDVRREQNPPAVSFEIVVRLDDGRYQLVRQDDPGGLREGDKVKIERGKVVLRNP